MNKFLAGIFIYILSLTLLTGIGIVFSLVSATPGVVLWVAFLGIANIVSIALITSVSKHKESK